MFNFFISLKLYSLINQFSFYTSFYRITLPLQRTANRKIKEKFKSTLYILYDQKKVWYISFQLRFLVKKMFKNINGKTAGRIFNKLSYYLRIIAVLFIVKVILVSYNTNNCIFIFTSPFASRVSFKRKEPKTIY